MNRHLLFTAALLALTSASRVATADAEKRPVIVAYEAPPECAPREAFQALVTAEVARAPNANRLGRFSVRIRRDAGAYEGALATQTGSRTVTSPRSDDITSAFAVIVAVADADLVPPSPPAVAMPVVPTPAPAVAVVAGPPAPPADPPVERGPRPKPREPSATTEWRVAARPFLWSHGPAADYGGSIAGVLGVVTSGPANDPVWGEGTASLGFAL
jgi:hypothetical protein